MPIPLTTFFRNESIAKNEKLTTLLKGTLLYDYASTGITWSTTAGSFLSSSIPQNESWTYFIPRSMTMNTSTQLTRSSNFGSSKNFTVMFRFYVSSLSAPGSTGTTVVANGTPGGPSPPNPPSFFWVIYMSGATSSTQKFQLLWRSGGVQQANFVIGPGTNIVAGEWYHVALKVVDNGSNNSFFGFINGLQTGASANQPYIDAPVGSTRLGNLGFGQAQSYELAEFIFLEEALSNDQIKGYASSPYI
jgi:hypothetical protein